MQRKLKAKKIWPVEYGKFQRSCRKEIDLSSETLVWSKPSESAKFSTWSLLEIGSGLELCWKKINSIQKFIILANKVKKIKFFKISKDSFIESYFNNLGQRVRKDWPRSFLAAELASCSERAYAVFLDYEASSVSFADQAGSCKH